MNAPNLSTSGTPAVASAAHVGRALLLISMLSIVMMSVGAFFVSYHFLHEQTQRHLRTLIAFTASESRFALQFRDTQTSSEILRAIPEAEGITLAELRDSSDEVLARVEDTRNDVMAHVARGLGTERISQDVVVEGKRVGRVTLEGGSGPLLRTLSGLLGWCVLVMLAVSLCSLLLARRYTQRITKPILALRTVVQRLIEHGDFSQRAPPSSLVEVEELRTEFNVLLDEIGVRDRLLTQTNAALQRVAYVDALTGLPNRAMFEQSLVRIIEGCARAGARATLFYLDIDAFKSVNDTFGHATGDALLSEIGSRLRAWHPDETVAARIGGDEFVVLVSPLREDQDIGTLTAALQNALDAPLSLNGQILHPGISIGSAIYPDTTRNASELICIADQAMYNAKDLRYRQNQITRWNTGRVQRG